MTISLMNNKTESPNPSTPLAFLPPALADPFEVSRYHFAVTLGAYVWDIASNLGNDYALLFKHRVRFPTIVYFMSRAFTLAYILVNVVYSVAPVKNCDAIALGFGICVIGTQATTAMLFFLRVTAVWHPSKITFAVFSILWIADPPCSASSRAVPSDAEVAVIMPLINDTAIFLAINYRILAHTIVMDSIVARLRVFLGGTGLSTLSQALLRSGQHFYLIAVAAQTTLLVLLKLPHLTPIYIGMFSVPAFALVHAMACLVFRRIKFGLISSDGISNPPITGLSEDFHATANPRSLSLHSRRTDPITTEFGSNTIYPLDVRVQKEIDKFEEGADGSQESRKPTTLA
ncbi:hypothetical protein MSAN_00587100 [Mycena sanguinolenta]|uniref:Uncharacterized protein n=1 Tax=Mycena sanguinolenta TaxID=230812 RepID=A0A8H6ZBC2_9AGAR|nr:hypothetical protein MSAN_00587100 [Mycena sanguinolenta]